MESLATEQFDQVDDDYMNFQDFTPADDTILEEKKTFDVAGTPQYMSPEMISEKGHDTVSDWWALGILLFELATGNVPFDNPDLETLADMICFDDLPYKRYFSKDFNDLLAGLTHKLPSRRLGRKGGASEIMAHPFFKNVDWTKVQNLELRPPIVPNNLSKGLKKKKS